MLKITTKNSRLFFARLQIVASIIFAIAHFTAVKLNITNLPETNLPRAVLYFRVPLILFSLYLTTFKNIFSQRTGDIIHSCVLILVMSSFSVFYSGSIGGDFIFLFFLLVVISVLYLDDFIPLFIGGLTGLIVGGEFFLTINFSQLSYMSFFKISLQIMSLFVVGWACSALVQRTLFGQRISEELRELTQTLKEKVKERTKELERAKEIAEGRTKETERSKEELQKNYGELQKKKEELEKFYKITIGREAKMAELKEKISEFEEKNK